jgi:hypothetical protein
MTAAIMSAVPPRRAGAGSAMNDATRELGAAFVDGLHFATMAGALLALGAAFMVWRFLPRHLAHEGAMHGAVESMEDAAELGIAGIPPVFADEEFVGDAPRHQHAD